ncbi:hypothetical protein [uncultured Desulfobacter sp.]|uniref:hypothetical protein n=1 Tax=uncultured Desulfobacter sp. TaxID=240139 RepID=UPI002AA907B4|nr:hypothetical protein [uncultured Desulfobacter sp.]
MLIFLFFAYDYMYYKDDYLTAAHYLEQATAFPQSPSYLPQLVARLYVNADSPEVAVAFLQEMIKATEKQALKNRLTERLHQVIHRTNMKRLQQGLDAFYFKLSAKVWRLFPLPRYAKAWKKSIVII